MSMDDQYTSSLLHFDGTDNASAYADESGIVWTGYGTAKLSTGQAKFGPTSLYFDGSPSYIYSASNSIYQFGNAEFCIDCWVYLLSTPGVYAPILEGRGNGGGYDNFVFGLNNIGGTLRLDMVTSTGRVTATTTAVSPSGWTHLAWSRDASANVNLFVNGTKDATRWVGFGNYFAPSRADVRMGGIVDGLYFYGYIDEFRVTKGNSRWTSSFTPRTSAYPPKPVSYLNSGRRNRMNTMGVSGPGVSYSVAD